MRPSAILLVFVCALFGQGLAPRASAAEPVDLEIVLSVDSSGSIDDEEFALQRLGYARALVHPDVLKAVRSGPHKAIALTFVEWSGPGIEEQIIPWTRVATREDLQKIAGRISEAPRTIFGGGTAIGAAIATGIAAIERSGFEARRRIIDISGDGFNNKGEAPDPMRDAAVARGIVVNGLTIGDSQGWLTEYYKHSVIGGRGAFVLSARGFDDFERAVLRKLVREIFVSQASAGVSGAAAGRAAAPRRAFR